MATKKQASNVVKGYGPPVSTETVRDYSNDPFVIDKLEKAKAFIREHPIPERILKKQN
ncbi:MAG: hypothetical protein NVSMB24_01810 [Mucilaginibacter sp.]|jgi:hypothetical protein